jgi:class 3 adenylate cyclase
MKMKRILLVVVVWLSLGFALATVLATLFGRRLGLESISDPNFAKPLLIKGIAAWLLFGIVCGMLSGGLYKTKYFNPFVDRLSRFTNTLLLVLVLAGFAKIGFEIMPDYSKLAMAQRVDHWLAPILAVMAALGTLLHLPPELIGIATSQILFVTLLIFARIAVNWGMREMHLLLDSGPVDVRVQTKERKRDPEAERKAQSASRRVAVASYTEAKALLAATQMQLTFLSMDVVGSTKMKQGEDSFVIEQSFTDYRTLVERTLRRHAAYKQTWTPDGQMAAFKDPQSAVNCAKEILNALPDFNRSVSKMKTEFKLRLGANVGVVSTDDATPMEQISDFSIDVAGHMQKYADPDSVWISEDVYRELTDTSGFEANGQEVDNRKVFAWKRPD